RSRRDDRRESLERADPLPSHCLTVPQAFAEVAIENDAATVAVPFHPAAEVLEAGAGAESERDAGDEKKLCVAEKIIEKAQICGLEKRMRGRLRPPIGESGTTHVIERQPVDTGLPADGWLDHPDAFACQALPQPGGVAAVTQGGDQRDPLHAPAQYPGETDHRVRDVAAESHADPAVVRRL